MKLQLVFRYFALLIFSCIATQGYSQKLSLDKQFQAVFLDPDFQTYKRGIEKSMEQKSKYYGSFSLENVDLSTVKDKETMIEVLRSAGMQHPEEYVETYDSILNAYKNLINKHKFLKKKTSAERNDFFTQFYKAYPAALPCVF